jgi:ribosomal protein S20
MSRLQVAGFAALLVVAALAGGTVIGSVAASTSPRVSAPGAAVVPAAASPATATSEACAAFRHAFAASLGVDESALTPAAKAASIATVDAAVAAGKLTKAAADRLKARIDKAAGDGCGLLAGRLARPRAALGVVRDGLTAAAGALGITVAELGAKLRGGTSLKDLAASRNVPYQALTDAIVGAVKHDLDAAVAAGTIRQPRADRVLDRLRQSLADGRLRKERAAPAGSATAPGPTAGS